MFRSCCNVPWRRASVLLIVLLGVVATSSCTKGVGNAWEAVIKNCSETDLTDKQKLLFFGTSNRVGPGSVWRPTGGDGFNLRWTAEDLTVASSDFVQAGALTSCDGKSLKTRKVDFGFLANVLTPFTASADVDFRRATEIEVSIDAWSWDDLVEGRFEASVNQRPEDDPAVQDLSAKDADGNAKPRFVMTRAVSVEGMVLKLTFDKKVAGDIKAKYEGTVGITKGDLGVSAEASWTGEGNTVLELKSSDRFYIAGVLAPWNQGLGLAGAEGAIGPETTVVDNPPLGREQP